MYCKWYLHQLKDSRKLQSQKELWSVFVWFCSYSRGTLLIDRQVEWWIDEFDNLAERQRNILWLMELTTHATNRSWFINYS